MERILGPKRLSLAVTTTISPAKRPTGVGQTGCKGAVVFPGNRLLESNLEPKYGSG